MINNKILYSASSIEIWPRKHPTERVKKQKPIIQIYKIWWMLQMYTLPSCPGLYIEQCSCSISLWLPSPGPGTTLQEIFKSDPPPQKKSGSISDLLKQPLTFLFHYLMIKLKINVNFQDAMIIKPWSLNIAITFDRKRFYMEFRPGSGSDPAWRLDLQLRTTALPST